MDFIGYGPNDVGPFLERILDVDCSPSRTQAMVYCPCNIEYIWDSRSYLYLLYPKEDLEGHSKRI